MAQVDKLIKTIYRAFIIEDYPPVREALKSLLTQEPWLKVVGEATSAESALDRLPDERPDIVLVNYSLPGMNGIELIRRLNQSQPELRCLIVSAYHEHFYIASALDAGARGYVVKGGNPKAILRAIARVMAGEVVVEPV